MIAGLISEATFALCFWLGSSATAASLIAFVAGAVPNYLMNRYWAWQRRDRIGGARELVPYLVIILSTALLATLITNGADALVQGRIEIPPGPDRAGQRRLPGHLRRHVRVEVRPVRPADLRRPPTYSRSQVPTMTRA